MITCEGRLNFVWQRYFTRLFRFEKSKILSNLHPTLSYENFGRMDMVIEAVFEDINIKHAVIKEVEKVLVTVFFFLILVLPSKKLYCEAK